MSNFTPYSKVERIEKEECSGLLEGTCYIFEKIDGANAQLYLDRDSGRVAYGNRSKVIGIGDKLFTCDDFRGLGKWVLKNEPLLLEFFNKWKEAIVYGEWLVKHAIAYNDRYMNNFYAFDIKHGEFFCHIRDPIWSDWPLPTIPLDAVVKDCKIEDLKQYLSLPSGYGAAFREGIVIKNYNFFNKYGRMPYGKLLNKDFVEVKRKPKTNVNPDDIEVELTRVYCTKARVIKICCKIKEASTASALPCEYDFKLEMKDVPRVMGMMFYDIITEDMYDILKKFRNPVINFKKFSNLVSIATKNYFIEYLEENA